LEAKQKLVIGFARSDNSWMELFRAYLKFEVWFSGRARALFDYSAGKGLNGASRPAGHPKQQAQFTLSK
jgi:hypothetical protein